MTDADPKSHSGLDLCNRIEALAARLEKEPKHALANVLAAEALMQPAFKQGWNALDKIEADLMERMGRWRENARSRALGRRIERVLSAMDAGKTLPKRRKAKTRRAAK